MFNKLRNILLLSGLGVCQSLLASAAKIVQLNGEVKIRRGLEENWETARKDMELETIDTILTLEGEAVLAFGEGATFKLGNNSVLDIADLRHISEQELFLILMSQKISRIKPASGKAPLRMGDVSTIRGAPFAEESAPAKPAASNWWRWEVNAAHALAAQNLLTNAALKWHRLKEKFPAQLDCGETSFGLAQTFEQLHQIGQACDEYRLAVQHAREQNCEDEKTASRIAIAEKRVQDLISQQ